MLGATDALPDDEFVNVSGHNDDSYNGQYVRGSDWNDRPHFVMGDKHLYYQPGHYWQLDNNDQEVVGFADRYAGGYDYADTYEGNLEEIDG